MEAYFLDRPNAAEILTEVFNFQRIHFSLRTGPGA
jgi:hypothetical protein